MIAEELGPVEGRTFDKPSPVPDREFRNGIVTEPRFRMQEGGDFVRCRIGADEQSIAARHFQRNVAWGVACSIEHPQPRHDVIAGLQHYDPVAYSGQVALRPSGELMQFVRHAGEKVRIHPEIPFGCADIVGCVGKSQATVRSKRAPDMVMVRVCEHDLGDRTGVDPGGDQVSGEPAVGGLIFVSRPDVDDDQILAISDDRNIGFGFDEPGALTSRTNEDLGSRSSGDPSGATIFIGTDMKPSLTTVTAKSPWAKLKLDPVSVGGPFGSNF